MRNGKSSRNSRLTGFTLIELLVSLTILATLITLVLGSVKALTQHLDFSRCTQNLRQLHIAFMGYVTDKNGVLPDKTPKRYYPYLGYSEGDIYQNTPFSCPSIQRTPNAAVGSYHRTMAINIYATTEKIKEPNRITRIQAPSKMILFTEAKIISDDTAPDGRIGKTYFSTTRLEDAENLLFPHHGLQNAIFVDGSVRRIDKEEFIQGGRWNTLFWRGYP